MMPGSVYWPVRVDFTFDLVLKLDFGAGAAPVVKSVTEGF